MGYKDAIKTCPKCGAICQGNQCRPCSRIGRPKTGGKVAGVVSSNVLMPIPGHAEWLEARIAQERARERALERRATSGQEAAVETHAS